MLSPSDPKQRNTLVDLVWLLIVLYFLYSITGFRHLGCQPAPPAVHWNAEDEADANRLRNDTGPARPVQHERAFP